MADSKAQKAGEAFAKLLKTDADFADGVAPTAAEIKLAAAALRNAGVPLGDIANPVAASLKTPEMQQALEDLNAERKRHAAEFEAEYGEPPPESLDDLVEWAIRAGWPADEIRSGNWTGAEIHPYIIGTLKKLRDQRDREGQKDNPKDKTKKLPRDERTRRAIQYVNSHRGKVRKGKAQPMDLCDIVADFAGEWGDKEVQRIYRALQPDRHGGHLLDD